MGMVSADDIGMAVEYLLPILWEERSVRYSRFYDGTDECSDHLREDIGIRNELLSVELVVDLAFDVLEEHGVVRRTVLDNKLADGEHDYQIDIIPGEPSKQILIDDVDV